MFQGHSGWQKRTLAAALVLAMGSMHSYGFAQSDEVRAGARAAAAEGAKAFHEHRWADAVDLFSRAESLVHAPPHLLYLARSYAGLGQLVKAQETYLKIAREHVDAGAPKAFVDAQNDAAKDLRDLEARIPFVKVSVQGAGAKAYVVTMDGAQVPAALVGVPRPVDPGEHKFQASAEGLASDLTPVVLKEGAHENVVLNLKPGTAVAVAAPPVDPAGTAGATPAAATGTPAAGDPAQGAPPATPTSPADTGTTGPSYNTGLRIGSYVSFGVGAVGLIVGTAFALKSKSKNTESTDLYNQDNCGQKPGCSIDQIQQIQDLDDQSNKAKGPAIGGFVVGGLGIVGGVVLFVLSNKHSSATPATADTSPKVTPWIGYNSAGLAGVF